MKSGNFCQTTINIFKRYSWLIYLAAIASVSANIQANEDVLLERARINQYIEEKHQLVDSHLQSNASIIKQIGNNNSASVMQSYSDSYQTGNFAFIQQKGDNNIGTISQQGGNNSAVIWQVGDNHNASINQRNNNTELGLKADIRQFGSSSNLVISQSGNEPRSISIEHHAYSGNALPVFIENH